MLFLQQQSAMAQRVCVIGGGSFGSAMARVAAQGVSANPDTFETVIPWWIRRAELAKEVNEKHTNSQYLAGASMPENLQATTELRAAAKDANICIMALPGEYVAEALADLHDVLAPEAVIVSLIKSLKVDDCRPVPYSEVMQKAMPGKHMAALMGPNLYKEMARDEFAEATIGCNQEHLWPVLKKLFETRLFHVEFHKDIVGVEMCGCLKNTITISCGIGKGLGYGGNVQAAIMRRGFLEIGAFLQEFFKVERDLLFEACGFGDLVLSCTVGRGQNMAAAFVENKGKKSWDELEAEMMNGMKLPDLHNIVAVHELLSKLPGGLDRYPLLTMTHQIAFNGTAPSSIVDALKASSVTTPCSADKNSGGYPN